VARYAPKFVEWLHAQNFVGLFDGERIASPCMMLRATSSVAITGSKTIGTWRYHPNGTRIAPLIIGDIADSQNCFRFRVAMGFALTVLDCLHHHIQPLADTARHRHTRREQTLRVLAGPLRGRDAVLHAFGQNDDAGQKWLAAVAPHCGCKCVHVVTPSPHKGCERTATARWCDRRRTFNAPSRAARIVIASIEPDLHTAPPKNVSKPVIVLPESNEDDALPAPFPLMLCRPLCRASSTRVARCERVPLALPAVCALVSRSAVLGAGLEVVSGANRVTRGNLFLLADAASGSGKERVLSAHHRAVDRAPGRAEWKCGSRRLTRTTRLKLRGSMPEKSHRKKDRVKPCVLENPDDDELQRLQAQLAYPITRAQHFGSTPRPASLPMT
jgi:hypothetical protein